MAFGVTKDELRQYKIQAASGEIAFLTHFWFDERFPQHQTVTKAASNDKQRLIEWGKQYGLKEEWIHDDGHFPHFDLIGSTEWHVLHQENKADKLLLLRAKSMKKKGSF
ncbi:hypothetical protein FLK61_31990 [Paenalkalicoccus suaedae]|uniref:YneQ n=1 Tax=Paenalkalicoccus suaedae TaxID=2592382 RepID=A0A859FEN5_9BACI|nr:hypothetical protein [Paenalkalicoccus suaedae]QKS71330.1 hypothetical protein FLK61_31990 [Paenalkalicoccus suaedae]